MNKNLESSLIDLVAIKNAIINNNMEIVCISMPSLGMVYEFNNDVKELITSCMKSQNEWIRKSAMLCLYHFYVRYRDKVCDKDFLRYIQHGLKDTSHIVIEYAQEVLSEIEEFSPKIYNLLINDSTSNKEA